MQREKIDRKWERRLGSIFNTGVDIKERRQALRLRSKRFNNPISVTKGISSKLGGSRPLTQTCSYRRQN